MKTSETVHNNTEPETESITSTKTKANNASKNVETPHGQKTANKTAEKPQEQETQQEQPKVGTLDNPSATGANPDLPGFTEKNLDTHFGGGGNSDHSDQYPEISKEQYAQIAHDLVRSPVGSNVDGYVATKGRNKGSVVRYDKTTHNWVRGTKNEITTMFKPDDKFIYFEKIKSYETGS